MSTKKAYEITKDLALNLFNDCLTKSEQKWVAEQLGTSLDKIEEVSGPALEHALMVYLRG